MKIELTINSRIAKKKYEVSNIGDGEVKWTTERLGVAGKLTFEVVKHGEIIFHEGDQVRLTVDGVSYFLGYVFSKSKTQEKISVTCYDMLRYLKAKQSYLFQNHTLTSVVKTIAKDFNLTQGEIDDTGFIMDEKLYESQSLFDIITDCIYRTGVATNKNYVLYDGVNQLCLKNIDDPKMLSKYRLTPLSLTREYNYKTSIDDSYNVIKLVQPDKSTKKGNAYSLFDQEKINSWGKLQYYATVSEDLDEAKIREKVVNLLRYYAQTQRTLKLTCSGVDDIWAGKMVLVDIPELGDIALNKKLLVNKCSHTWNGADHTMELEMKIYNG